MGYSIVKRGIYNERVENFVYPTQYLFAKKEPNSSNRLILKLFNDRSESLNKVSLRVVQYDSTGNQISVDILNCKAFAPKKQEFALDCAFFLQPSCDSVSVEVEAAFWGRFKYTPNKGGVAFSYEKPPDEPKRAIVQGVRARNFKIPAIICALMLCLIGLSVVFGFYQLKNYVKNAQTFSYKNVEYAFVGSDSYKGKEKPLNADVYVVGAKRYAKDIVIEDAIKGHKVVAISDGAFRNNPHIESVVINAQLEVGTTMFENCFNLKSVTLNGPTVIGDYAFSYCNNLTDFKAYNLTAIKKGAFNGNKSLKNIDISGNKGVLTIDESAFSGCDKIESVQINQFVDFSQNKSFFNALGSLKRLRLKNLNYSFKFNGVDYGTLDAMSISQLFRSPVAGVPALEELIIEYCNALVDDFCNGFSKLKSLRVINSQIDRVGERAFYGCTSLASFEIGSKLSYVGEYGFFGSKISGIDLSDVTHIGAWAFANNGKLAYTNLENNSLLNELGAWAFENCVHLKSVAIPSAITVVNEGVFYGCASLEEVKHFDQIEEIKGFAFGGCVKLKAAPILNAKIIGASAFSQCTSLKQLDFSSELWLIGAQAFYGCSGIESLVVPDGVFSIGMYAFDGMNELKEVTLPFIGGYLGDANLFSYVFSNSGVYQNSVPVSLKKVTITKTTHIESYAFYGSSYIEQIEFLAPLVSIGSFAFGLCTSLNGFVIPSTVSQIGTSAFTDCYKLFEVYNLSPLNVEAGTQNNGMVGFYALKVYNSLFQEPIPRVVQNGYELMRSDQGKWYMTRVPLMQKLSLPNSVLFGGERIESYELVKYLAAHNSVATTLNVPSSVSAIGQSAFLNCNLLTEVSIEKSVKSIGFGAFELANSITSITLPFVGNSPTNKRYFSYIFGSSDPFYWNAVPFSLKTVTLTNESEIPNYAFYACLYIQSISLPELVDRIGEYAFNYCESLQSINLPDSIDYIGANAFYRCTSLREVVLPAMLAELGAYAFYGCYGLSAVTLFSNATIGENAFFDCTGLYEVFNLSSLSIKKGAATHGYLGFYAIAINNSLSAPRLKDGIINGVYIKYSATNGAIVGYGGDATSLRLSDFSFSGTKITSLIVVANAFSYANTIVDLTIGEEIEKIGEYAFYSMNGLKTLTFEEGNLKTIAKNAFDSCIKLSSVVLPQSLVTIDEYAFNYCIGLYSITINENLLSIGEYAFRDCYALKDIINHSSLNITKASKGYGEIALYALRVSRLVGASSLKVVEKDGFCFMQYSGKWYLIIAPLENMLSLPQSFEDNGETVDSYIVAETVFLSYYHTVFIPRSVSGILADANQSLAIYQIRYEGTLSEWTQLAPSSNFSNIWISYECLGLYN